MHVCCYGYHGAVVNVFSQQVAVVERSFGFSRHCVDWPFIHLIFNGSVEHVQRLTCHLLTDRQTDRQTDRKVREGQAEGADGSDR